MTQARREAIPSDLRSNGSSERAANGARRSAQTTDEDRRPAGDPHDAPRYDRDYLTEWDPRLS
jgi:hypothetical protein